MIITGEEERRRKKGAQKTFLACPSSPALRLSTDSWRTNENKTLKGKIKNTLYLKPSALPGDPAQTPLCCQRNGLPMSVQIGPL